MRRRYGVAIAAAVLGTVAFWSGAQAQGWVPTKNVELISDTAAGGGGDRQTRETARILSAQKVIPRTMAVMNKPGGAGGSAVAYMNSHRGDPHYLVQMTNSWFTDAVLNNNMDRLEDVTPIF